MASKKKLVSNNNDNTYFSQKIGKKTRRKPLCNNMSYTYSMLDEKTYKPQVGTDVIGRIFGRRGRKDFPRFNFEKALEGFKRKEKGKIGGKLRKTRKLKKTRK